MKKYAACVALLASLLFVASASAKEGYYLGAYIPMESLSGSAGNGVSSGSGWGLRFGDGFNRYASLEGNYSVTKHGSSGDLRGLAGDLKVNFPLTSLDTMNVMTVEPYLRVGFAHYEISPSSKTYKSDGLQYGIGVELYLFQEVSVNAGITKSKISWDTSPKTDGYVTTVDIGIIYHFI